MPDLYMILTLLPRHPWQKSYSEYKTYKLGRIAKNLGIKEVAHRAQICWYNWSI